MGPRQSIIHGIQKREIVLVDVLLHLFEVHIVTGQVLRAVVSFETDVIPSEKHDWEVKSLDYKLCTKPALVPML